MNTIQSQKTIRLSHYVPVNIGNGDITQETKVDIILNALFILNKFSTLSEIQRTILEYLGCDFTSIEIEEILSIGESKELIISASSKYSLLPSTKEKISQLLSEEDDLEDQAYTKWIEKVVLPKYGQLPEEIVDEVKEQLMKFVSNIIFTHGAESLQLIANDQKQINFPTIQDYLQNLNSGHPMVEKIARNEFPTFLASDDAEIANYNLKLINKAVQYLCTIADPEIISELKNQINGKFLYLDSSTVYRLLNLQGRNRFNVVKEVVNICVEMGLTLKVSAMTLDELKRRIKFDSGILKEYPTPVNLSAVGYKYLTEENFISTYWEESARTGIEVNEFIHKYINIDLLLEHEGIVVEKEFPEQSVDFMDLQRQYDSKISQRKDHMKSEKAIVHDAYLIALVEEDRLRKTISRFTECPSWILTTDQFFIRFQKTEYLLKNNQPIALLPTHLINLFRFIKPREEKYSEIFLNVFSRSFIASNSRLRNEEIQKILKRVSMYKGYTPRLAEQLLSDQLFIGKITTLQDEGEKDELIHDTLIEKTRELEKKTDEDKQKINELNLKVEEFTDSITEKENKIDQVLGRLRDKERQIDELSAEVRIMQKKEEQRRSEEQELRERKKKRRIKIIATCIYLLLSILFYLWFKKTPPSTKWLRSGQLVIITLGIIPLSFILFNNKIAKWMLGAISLIATLYACIYSIL